MFSNKHVRCERATERIFTFNFDAATHFCCVLKDVTKKTLFFCFFSYIFHRPSLSAVQQLLGIHSKFCCLLNNDDDRGISFLSFRFFSHSYYYWIDGNGSGAARWSSRERNMRHVDDNDRFTGGRGVFLLLFIDYNLL